jgi:hypothetical protein
LGSSLGHETMKAKDLLGSIALSAVPTACERNPRERGTQRSAGNSPDKFILTRH